MSKTKKPVRIWKVLLSAVLAAVILLVGAFLALTLTEYKPEDVEAVTPPAGKAAPAESGTMTVVIYNTGYAALGENADFFMDGGTTTMPEDRGEVEANLKGIAETLKALDADVIMLQEVDTGSKRSFGIDEAAYYAEELGLPFDYALNYSSAFVPFPLSSMMGKVKSGLATYTDLAVSSSERIQLPCPFSWPVRCFNLKRCLLVNRIPVGDRELVMINLHLEAYDSGEGKIAQTKMLYELLSAELEKGNYVIAGGDFNQTFPGAYFYEPLKEGNWMPGILEDTLPEGFGFVFDDSKPTCRLLDVPYKGNDAPQYYIIDGFIVSSNVNVESVEVVETGFVSSDHQPVKLVFTLGE